VDVAGIAEKSKYGGAGESDKERLKFLAAMKLDDLLLARECAEGRAEAWERFMLLYRETLYSAAYGITRSEERGRELADSLYAELFGLKEKDGERQSPLRYYHGRGSLAGWLRSVLAQRFVDGYRATKREVAIEEGEEFADVREAEPDELTGAATSQLGRAVETEIAALDAEERFLLASYYIDGRTLKQIAGLMGVHESTVSRQVTKLAEQLKRRVGKRLQKEGLSKRQMEEMMEVDVRDLQIPIKKILQGEPREAYIEQGGSAQASEIAKGGGADD
jgi:RNA polymerase sigma-70 factor (ECF subfamily)